MAEPVRGQFIRAGVLQRIEEALRREGVDPVATLAKIGFSPANFSDGDELLHIDDISRLLAHCARATGKPHFSLLLAECQDLTFLGDLGLLLRTSESLATSLMELTDYIHIHAQPVHWTIEDAGDYIFLKVAIDHAYLSPAERLLGIDLAMAQHLRGLQRLATRPILPEYVTHYSPRPDDTAPYEKFFKRPVRFGSEENRCIYRKSDLRMPVTHSDPELHAIVRDRIRQSGSFYRGSSLTQQVRSIIRSLLPRNACSIDAVAKALGCDRRTLQRHLRADYDATYQQLLDEVRFNLAQLYLRETNMGMTNLAYAVGFTDSGNMSRAFRKHVGQTPRDWRTENQRESVHRNRLALR